MRDHRMAGLTGAVLAGGKARRMGHVNKALVTVGGAPVIDRILDRLAETCGHVMVVANDPEPYRERGIAVVPDAVPGHGALGGLHAALLNAPTPAVFVCGCDMPFISTALIRHLAHMLGPADAVVPRDGYGLQPLHAVYAARIAPLIPPFLMRGELRMERFVASLDARILPPADIAPYAEEAEIFFNINTPADLDQARAKSGMV